MQNNLICRAKKGLVARGRAIFCDSKKRKSDFGVMETNQRNCIACSAQCNQNFFVSKAPHDYLCLFWSIKLIDELHCAYSSMQVLLFFLTANNANKSLFLRNQYSQLFVVLFATII